jgi:Tfp pilus assembly protein PilO
MSQSTKTAVAVAVAVVIVLAGAFWLLLLAPKRQQASELSERVTSIQSEVAAEDGRVSEALVARREFPHLYRQLVLQGKAVPSEAATPSLMVQLNGVGRRSATSFQGIQLKGTSAESAPVASAESVSPTESAAALLPIGATVGPAGFSAMPYALQYGGGFFGIADFIQGLDELVSTKDGVVDANGRLVTFDGFEIKPEEEGTGASGAALEAHFNVTTYVTPPGQGITAGATGAGPAPETTPNLP